MDKQKRVFTIRRMVLQSLRLDALTLLLDLAILVVYSPLQGVAFSDLLIGGFLEFILLVEAGVLLLAGGAYVTASGISFGKLRERVFHSEGWSPEVYRRSEVRALPIVFAGALVLTESLVLALV